MNQLLILIVTLIFSNQHQGSSFRTEGAKPIDTVKIVGTIKAQFAAIDSKRKLYALYEPRVKEDGILLTGFYEGTVLKMINTIYYTESSRTESDLYVNETGIFFIYSKVFEYMSPLSVDPKGTTKSITENWYYFNNEEMIKWVSAKKVKPAGSEEFILKKDAFKAEFKKTKNLFSDFTVLRKVR